MSCLLSSSGVRRAGEVLPQTVPISATSVGFANQTEPRKTHGVRGQIQKYSETQSIELTLLARGSAMSKFASKHSPPPTSTVSRGYWTCFPHGPLPQARPCRPCTWLGPSRVGRREARSGWSARAGTMWSVFSSCSPVAAALHAAQ